MCVNKKFTYWSCKNDHKVMFCDAFLNKDVINHKQFVTNQQLCFNCLSKKTCQRLYLRVYMSPRIMRLNHHTLLPSDKKPMLKSNSPANPNKVNTVQTAPQENPIDIDEAPDIPLSVNKIKTHHQKIQVLPVKISNENKYVTANALFDSGSESTLLAQNVANYLDFSGKEQLIPFSKAISQKSKVKVNPCVVRVSSRTSFSL